MVDPVWKKIVAQNVEYNFSTCEFEIKLKSAKVLLAHSSASPSSEFFYF
jgi:hypothetical protein